MPNHSYLHAQQQRINRFLDQTLPPAIVPPAHLHKAIRYAVLNGGKRLRALLVYCTGQLFGVSADTLDPLAAAVELIHTYSLVHDDLPAMDDDDIRRGKASCHVAFDEATAILVGDALQTLALQMILREEPYPNERTMLKTLLAACSSQGLVGGQAMDLAATGKMISAEDIETMYQLKTGALINASILLGAYAAGHVDENELNALNLYANDIGLAFQIHDDILDIEQSTETLGKPQGTDLSANKATYPAIVGLDAAKEKVQVLYQTTLKHLNAFDQSSRLPLEQLTEFMIQRTY